LQEYHNHGHHVLRRKPFIMTPKNRVIIDTDPGVDDVLAMLLALAATSKELEVILIAVTFGNIDVRSCLRNVVAIFHVLEKELDFRRSKGIAPGFEGVTKFKPIVAIGPSDPLQDLVSESADYFHGPDGLAGVHSTHPHFSPAEDWEHLFNKPPPESLLSKTAGEATDGDIATTRIFTPSLEPAHKELLRVLREEPENTVTIVAIGPMTNCALAAADDPETFLRCKEIVTMGATMDMPGNVTPVAEFNVFADAYAAARVYALTSLNPAGTMPPPPLPRENGSLQLNPYPPNLSKQLKLTLMSLDITEHHTLDRGLFREIAEPVAKTGSPLAQWMVALMGYMLDKMERLNHGQEGDSAALALHDPMCIWYLLTQDHPGWEASVQDIRVETAGQWTKGMTLADRRSRKRRDSDGEVPHDRGNWLGRDSGNRVRKMIRSPGQDILGRFMLEKILGSGK
jgi:inosine-uridine nucleoside N-ribohydrolase